VDALVERVLAMTVAEREALGVPSGRSDVIGAGALILDRVLLRSSAEHLRVSDSDILDGIAWSVA
jgi:exopolyphosphatase/guanosine-5'-triphosphate,3'-diphosphate pyrophosphatase